jgi:hypothetical protein
MHFSSKNAHLLYLLLYVLTLPTNFITLIAPQLQIEVLYTSEQNVYPMHIAHNRTLQPVSEIKAKYPRLLE